MASKRKPTPIAVAVALMRVLTPEGIAWPGIVLAIEKEFEVENWLTEVRGPLQLLRNHALVERTKDVEREVWYRVPTDLTQTDLHRILGAGEVSDFRLATTLPKEKKDGLTYEVTLKITAPEWKVLMGLLEGADASSLDVARIRRKMIQAVEEAIQKPR